MLRSEVAVKVMLKRFKHNEWGLPDLLILGWDMLWNALVVSILSTEYSINV